MTWPNYLPQQNQLNPRGETRRFGLEIEFSGMDIDAAAAAVSRALRARQTPLNSYEFTFDSPHGTFKLERDVTFLKELGRREQKGEALGVYDRLKQATAPIAETIMPLEIVAPPLRFDQLAIVDRIVDALAAFGGEGTTHHGYYAFGVHVNPEAWSLDASDLVRVARAFAILQRHLFAELDVDLARRLTPFITPWPDSYVALVINDNYSPTLETFVDDYVRENPTRGRALDLLVVLAHLDEKRVRDQLPEEAINPRPAFHYRLPNSLVGQRGWSASEQVRAWSWVEQLACDDELLAAAAADMRRQLDDAVVRAARPPQNALWLEELGARCGR